MGTYLFYSAGCVHGAAASNCVPPPAMPGLRLSVFPISLLHIGMYGFSLVHFSLLHRNISAPFDLLPLRTVVALHCGLMLWKYYLY